MDIVQAIRAQMLGQFIDALSGAAKGSLSPEKASAGAPANAEAPELQPGQTVTATVIGPSGDGRLALSLQGRPVIADLAGSPLPASARQPGATLQLTVDAGGATPRLALSGFQPPPAGRQQTPPAPEAVQRLPGVRLVAQPDQAAATQPAQPQRTPLETAAREAIAAAAPRQGSAAPLFADLARLAALPQAPLPEPVKAIAAAILATRLDAGRPIKADALQQAIATALPPEALAQRPNPPLDVKTLLTALKALLPPAPDQPATLQRTAAPLPEPPHRESAPAAQRPASPALGPDSAPQTVVATLARETEQALERTKLNHYASLPEQRPATAEGQRPQQLAFELPLAIGQQTAMAGFRLERDRRRRQNDGSAIDVWGIRFAIETDEIGAVHAHLRLAGPALSVSLWADDPATQAAFRDAAPLLEAALRDAALDVGEIAVFGGRPHEARGSSRGGLLDVSS